MIRNIQIAVICITTTVVLFFVFDNIFDKLNSGYNYKYIADASLAYIQTTENKSQLLFDHCPLRRLDPWDPLVNNEFNTNDNPLKDCKIKYKQLTNIENNSVIIDPKLAESDCSYRCLMPKNDYIIDYKAWVVLKNGTKPECDVIQIKCFNRSKLEYQFMHTLIYRNEPNLTPPDPPDMPSVHIIILDSVSSSQFERSMIRTSTFLRNVLQAKEMKHLNKIGLNSRPNGYALLFGKARSLIPKSPFSRGYPADYPRDPCNDALDNDQFVSFRYQDAGYVTYMAEDWGRGVFNWPNCIGFRTKPMDHYMRPFQLFLERNSAETKYYADILTKQMCKEHDKYILEYFQQFLETYEDRPSFSINWMSELAHDNINGLYHIDEYFYRFFQRNEKIFNNSYVFFMGDHGNRFHRGRNTWVGEAEDNNPMLWISVPQNMRTSEVLNQLEENSKKLISHYDIYATLNNIVKPKNPRKASILLHGENLFGPLSEPRTCDRLRIPFEFCSCNFGKTKLPKNDDKAVEIANHCIEKMNDILQSDNETGALCARLSLNLTSYVTAETFTEKSSQTIYQLSWTTTPGNGRFSATVIKEANGAINIVSQKFPRSDAYAAQAKCAKHAHFSSYCYCKDLLSNMTTSTTTAKPAPDNILER